LLIYEKEGESEIRPVWQHRPLRLNVSALLNGFVIPEAQQEERRRLFPEKDLGVCRRNCKSLSRTKKWRSVSIEGLIKAAENVGKIGVPVIELAGKILELLAKL